MDDNQTTKTEEGVSKPDPLTHKHLIEALPFRKHTPLQWATKQGTYTHAAYLMVTVVACPPLLSLPWALAQLGWIAGIINLILATAASFYSSCLLVVLAEAGGRRFSRYRSISEVLMLEKNHVRTIINCLQLTVNVGASISFIILIASLLGDICTHHQTESCALGNSVWTVIAGVICLSLSQFRDLSSLNFVVILSTLSVVIFSTIATVLAGIEGGETRPSFERTGSTANQVFSAFNALGVTAFVYGNTLLPEIQATLHPDTDTNSTVKYMLTSVMIAYCVFAPVYIIVAVVGYWAYGTGVNAYLLLSVKNPYWLIVIADVLSIIDLAIITHCYNWLLYVALERLCIKLLPNSRWMIAEEAAAQNDGGASDQEEGNIASYKLQLIVRPLYLAFITFVAAAMPFFSSIAGFVGAVGLTPLTYVLPAVLYVISYKDSLSRPAYWFNVVYAVFWSLVGCAAAVGALQQIIVTASSFNFFP